MKKLMLIIAVSMVSVLHAGKVFKTVEAYNNFLVEQTELITKKFGTANEREWILTRKMMKAAYGIEVREVLMNRSVRSLIKNGFNR